MELATFAARETCVGQPTTLCLRALARLVDAGLDKLGRLTIQQCHDSRLGSVMLFADCCHILDVFADKDAFLVISSDGLFSEEERGGGGGLENESVAKMCR